MSRGTRQTLDAGKAAPDFRLESLEGGTVVLSEMLKAGPVVLAFYKVSCPTCQLTIPFLNRLHSAGVQALAISQNPPELTAQFNREYRVEAPTLLDKSEEGYPVSNAYGLTHVPSLFLVGTDGKVTWTSASFIKRELEDLGGRVGVEIFQPGDRVPDFKGG
ncbi:MAG: redoxin domain-containing protein [Bryobacterales bacterium]|nr:redoxin domain-containing protein [Bryobacterales bacterium]